MQSNRGMTTFWEIHFRTSVEWTITEVYSLDFTDFPPIKLLLRLKYIGQCFETYNYYDKKRAKA